MSNQRLWLYRGLVAITAGLMIASALMPWWTCTIDVPYVGPATPLLVEIYQHGLSHNMVELRDYVAADETPLYQTVLAWVYIAVSVGLILYSTRLKGNKGRWLLGGIGLVYIAYAAIAIFVVVANRIADFDISLTGWSSTVYQDVVDVTISYFASLETGYYLAYVAGAMCIVLALFRDRITGRAKLSA